MKQLPLFGMFDQHDEKIINVASVTHRSPFRYPGGKTWLVPRIKTWLKSLDNKPVEFIESFAGGGIVGLTVAFEGLAQHVTLVELDKQVAAVWQTIIENGEGPWLADRIRFFDLTPENVDELLLKIDVPLRELAFQTIVKNRINRGGILAHGAGRIKYGENGRGIASRWYPETLRKRILDITHIREKLTFIHGDGLRVIRDYSTRPDVVFFVDPPYTASDKKPGSRLYEHSEIDHEALFDLLANVEGDFLMTYDNNRQIRKLARDHNFDLEVVAMKNTHHAKLSELLIGKNLTWLRFGR